MRVTLLALAPRAHGGQYQYTVTLIDAFRQLAEQDALELTVVRRSDYAGVSLDGAGRMIGLNGRRARLDALAAAYLGSRLQACPRGPVDIAVSPKACLAAKRCARRSVVTLHDLQHRRLPHLFSPTRRLLRDWLYARTAASADGIVCETEQVKRDIQAYYGTSPEWIYVVPSPPPSYIVRATVQDAELERVRAKYRLARGYLFYPAQFWRHKNHLVLIEALARVRDAFGIRVPLVLVGAPKENFGPTIRRTHDLRLDDQVAHLGYVPDEDMPALFKSALALVVPSLFESLSIPIWEAFHLGVPVICANGCAFPEQVGAAALLFDPANAGECAERIRQCVTNPSLRETLVARGRERIGQLTLERYAAQWKEVLDAVGGK